MRVRWKSALLAPLLRAAEGIKSRGHGSFPNEPHPRPTGALKGIGCAGWREAEVSPAHPQAQGCKARSAGGNEKPAPERGFEYLELAISYRASSTDAAVRCTADKYCHIRGTTATCHSTIQHGSCWYYAGYSGVPYSAAATRCCLLPRRR